MVRSPAPVFGVPSRIVGFSPGCCTWERERRIVIVGSSESALHVKGHPVAPDTYRT